MKTNRKKTLNCKVYFCDRAALTQKPLIERTNRDVKYFSPKSKNLNKYSQNYINEVTDILMKNLDHA